MAVPSGKASMYVKGISLCTSYASPIPLMSISLLSISLLSELAIHVEDAAVTRDCLFSFRHFFHLSSCVALYWLPTCKKKFDASGELL